MRKKIWAIAPMAVFVGLGCAVMAGGAVAAPFNIGQLEGKTFDCREFFFKTRFHQARTGPVLSVRVHFTRVRPDFVDVRVDAKTQGHGLHSRYRLVRPSRVDLDRTVLLIGRRVPNELKLSYTMAGALKEIRIQKAARNGFVPLSQTSLICSYGTKFQAPRRLTIWDEPDPVKDTEYEDGDAPAPTSGYDSPDYGSDRSSYGDDEPDGPSQEPEDR